MDHPGDVGARNAALRAAIAKWAENQHDRADPEFESAVEALAEAKQSEMEKTQARLLKLLQDADESEDQENADWLMRRVKALFDSSEEATAIGQALWHSVKEAIKEAAGAVESVLRSGWQRGHVGRHFQSAQVAGQSAREIG